MNSRLSSPRSQCLLTSSPGVAQYPRRGGDYFDSNPWIFRSFLALEPRLSRIRWLNSFIEMRSGRSGAKANLKAIKQEPKPSGVRSIVVGYGPVGQNAMTKILYEFGIEPTIIELNIDTVLQIRAEGHHAIYGDASRGARYWRLRA
ncbi:MAG: NAD-binding protein [Thermodesulfobacteriota bacterium]